MALSEFGLYLRKERVQHRIYTQEALSEALSEIEVGAVEVSAASIGHVENGRRLIGPAVFDACARLFEWGPSEFRRAFLIAYRPEVPRG